MEGPGRTDLAGRLREAERRAYEAEAAYETLLGQVPGAIYAYAPELGGPTLSMSAYIEELLGVPAERFLSGDAVWDELLHPDDRDRAWTDYESFLLTGTPDTGDYRYIRPDGRVVWIHDRSALVRDRDGAPLLVQGVMFDITATKEMALRMQHMAFHDILTGLPNRAMFQDHLELALARARRHELAVAVLFLDLDDFKPVNDTHGHEVGDEVLQHAAKRIRGAARDTDLVARQGGDEFLVLLADIDVSKDVDAAMTVAQEASGRISRSIAAPVKVGGAKLSVRASIGCALFPSGAGDARSLLRLADADMYARKRERFDPSTGIHRFA
jgi:diguanylate cyclase (GGDEF)-like protein/PAS domain S-box-containing protein